MAELKTPRRYRRHRVVERTVRLLTDVDVLVCFQRPALEEARALRPGIRTCQHVGYGVSTAGDGATPSTKWVSSSGAPGCGALSSNQRQRSPDSFTRECATALSMKT